MRLRRTLSLCFVAQKLRTERARGARLQGQFDSCKAPIVAQRCQMGCPQWPPTCLNRQDCRIECEMDAATFAACLGDGDREINGGVKIERRCSAQFVANFFR